MCCLPLHFTFPTEIRERKAERIIERCVHQGVTLVVADVKVQKLGFFGLTIRSTVCILI